MKILTLGMLISLAWFAVQGKSMIANFTQMPEQIAVKKPDTGMQKMVVERLKDVDEEKLKELGIEKDSLNVEVYSPGIILKKEGEKSIDSFTQRLLKTKDILTGFAKNLVENALNYLGIFFITIVILRFLKFWPILRIISGLFFALSRLSLFIISIAALVLAYYSHTNLWDTSVFFWFPAGILCISALGLKFLDMNFPVWRRIYGSFILPIISGVAVSFII
ncbi:MAG: hypothetical protein JW871_03990 [Endomicrobiales bacterium]|nr:hypothetical protein [Endomicrobiales bacterium]